jgi:hypothetical protein
MQYYEAGLELTMSNSDRTDKFVGEGDVHAYCTVLRSRDPVVQFSAPLTFRISLFNRSRNKYQNNTQTVDSIVFDFIGETEFLYSTLSSSVVGHHRAGWCPVSVTKEEAIKIKDKTPVR